MAFKKQDWNNYKRKGEIIEITTRDQSGAKTGTFKATNQKDYSKVLGIIKDKLGYKPEIVSEDKEIEEEINWLKESVKW